MPTGGQCGCPWRRPGGSSSARSRAGAGRSWPRSWPGCPMRTALPCSGHCGHSTTPPASCPNRSGRSVGALTWLRPGRSRPVAEGLGGRSSPEKLQRATPNRAEVRPDGDGTSPWQAALGWLRASRLGLVVIALAVGGGAGLGAVGFRWLIFSFTWLATGHYQFGQQGRVGSAHLPWLGPWFVLLIPVLGGLVYGPLIQRFAREARG